jgi:hypothetical protein
MSERTVHLVNGDITATRLAETDLPGEMFVWADALDEGPLLPVADPAFREARASFWSRRGLGSSDKITLRLAAMDDHVDRAAASASEIVLWYEHDLFDQLALVHLLARIHRLRSRATLTLVSIDKHPEVDNFMGLAQLESHQLAGLWPRRTPVARDIFDEAIAAWVALTAPDPRAIHFVARRSKALPFLAGALDRHVEEFPDPHSGLSRSQRQILAAVARGIESAGALLPELHLLDPRYLVTDVTVLGALRELARCELIALPSTMSPAHAAPCAADLAATGYRISERGRECLSGRIDRIATAGIDEWRGGVALRGNGPLWRWDPAERRLGFC